MKHIPLKKGLDMKAIGYLHPQSIEQKDALVDIEVPKPKAEGRDLVRFRLKDFYAAPCFFSASTYSLP